MFFRYYIAVSYTHLDVYKRQVYKEVEQTQQMLAAHIKNTVSQELSQAVTSAEQSLRQNTANFVDKTKADLATELPALLHASAAIIKTDIEQTLSELQAQGIANVQENLTLALPAMEQTLTRCV